MPYRVTWSKSAHEDMEALFDYLAEHVSVADAGMLCDRLLNATDRLVEFPRLYEAAPEWGEGVRRLSMAGQHVLHEVDDLALTVTVLAVVGQRQKPQAIR